ncbi:Uncharacterized protein MSYG_0811 [Malassezia sympodialis ATCC 42132]|uniref:EH domain-containing protein n=1 Tax=Malassezia sympodialis (strain ATCC 42132) TaxID=1230383 RepID=A0A1M8A230_MALS4|nr:Uncharacterized protein MSYG_0811 [Malassezia sympodialis ATCC 42132]
MSTEQAVSVKNLRTLFENASTQAPQRDIVEGDLTHRKKVSGDNTVSTAVEPGSSADPTIGSDVHTDNSRYFKPQSNLSLTNTEVQFTTNIHDAHSLSELDRNGEIPANFTESPVKPVDPLTEASTTHTMIPMNDLILNSDSVRGHEGSKECSETMPLSDIPKFSTPKPETMESKSMSQMRPSRPPRPNLSTKPQSVDEFPTQSPSKPVQMTNTPSLPKRPIIKKLEAPDPGADVPENSPAIDCRKKATTIRRSAPLPPARSAKNSAPVLLEKVPQPGLQHAPESTKYESLFQKLCIHRTPDPVVRAGAVKLVWNRSGLPAKDLSYIWRTVTDNDSTCSSLTIDQFITGTRMIDKKLERVPAIHYS